jgi:hypothetical protein
MCQKVGNGDEAASSTQDIKQIKAEIVAAIGEM